MLAPDVRFEGFTTTDWTRVLSLFQPRRAGGDRQPDRPRGGVVAVHHDGALIKLVHTQVGRLRLDEARAAWPLAAEALASRHHASWAVSLERGALDDVMEGFGARATRADDGLAQVLTILELAQAEIWKGRIEAWPRRLRGVPIPSAAMINGSLDMICPVGRAIVVGLFEDGELWTSIALRRARRGLDLILGPDELRLDMGLLAGDWRRDHRHLAHTIEDRVGPLALGCYAEVDTFRRLEVDPTPGAWARAVAVRDVILSPLPAPLAIPLGLDAGRAAFAALRSVAERVDPLGIAGPTLERIKERLKREDVQNVLGFHPLELLRRLLTRER